MLLKCFERWTKHTHSDIHGWYMYAGVFWDIIILNNLFIDLIGESFLSYIFKLYDSQNDVQQSK